MQPALSLVFFLATALAACAQPNMLPATGLQTPAASAAEHDTGGLSDQLAAAYGIAGDPARGVSVKQVESGGEKPLFVAFTIGLPPEDDDFTHKVSLHAPGQAGWTELARTDLECVSYLEEAWREPACHDQRVQQQP